MDDRVDDFMVAPAAAAMFVLAADGGLGPDRLAEPATVTALATVAVHHLNPWTGESAGLRAEALTAVRRLRPLVTAVVTDPRNAWWSAPLDRSVQLVLTGRDEPRPDPLRLPVPTGPIDRWEVYAQKLAYGLTSSTELPVPAGEAIRSGAHAELDHGGGDWHPDHPVSQTRLRVADTARVHEITSAADWHDLALRYGDPGTHPGPDANLLAAAGIDHGLAPTWSAVAADHDGVHLTFAGLLTALHVPVTTDGITTTLWAWEWECTHWLRSVFTDATALPDLTYPHG